MMLGPYISSSPPLSSLNRDTCFYPSAVLEYLLSVSTLFTALCPLRWSTCLDFLLSAHSFSHLQTITYSRKPRRFKYKHIKMVAYRIIFLAGAVAALPLNINLGAYSPALVVGKRSPAPPPGGPIVTI